MVHFHIARKTRLRVVIAISVSFFIAEISAGFYTKSLALVADAFHYLADIIGFSVALAAVHMHERTDAPASLSFGWARASLLGAFFNGVFLLGLGLSISLQSIERFIRVKEVENPTIVLIVGSVGLVLNLISGIFLHEHNHGHRHNHAHAHNHAHDEEAAHPTPIPNDQDLTRPPHNHTAVPPTSPQRDLGMLGALLHVLSDALNNIGVITSALIILFTHSSHRFYADPATSLYIGLMILCTAIPLTRRSGTFLLQTAPRGIDIALVKKDLESIPGVLGLHELHVWSLDQTKVVASAHVVVAEEGVADFMRRAKLVGECLHRWGVHSVTLQPELLVGEKKQGGGEESSSESGEECRLTCGVECRPLRCCE